MIFPLSRGCVNASRNVAKIANEFEIRCSVDSINTFRFISEITSKD